MVSYALFSRHAHLIGPAQCANFRCRVQLYNRGRPQMTMMSHIARALIHDLKINKDLADEALISSVYSKFVEHLRPPPSHEVRRALLSCYITSSA